ncbi:MAG: molecular chaperone DnaJ [Rhodobacterales bacterium 12-64-8]|nr:MAG: molecular chaperone DnaJ [Rhodobacterales bacterium 12-64-8]
MSERSYYDILGVPKDADEKTLKSAFRKKAMEHHPDRNPGCAVSEGKFKEVSEAWEILSDAQKRTVYDRFGKQGLNGGGGGQQGRPEDVFRDVFGDMFSELFGGQRQARGGPGRGADLRYDYEITLEEAFRGKQAEITVPTTERCEPCNGSGAEPGTQPETCTTCQGHGRVRVSQGFFTMERTCGRCQGSGHVIKTPCRNCDGRGANRRERTLQITIPAGIEDGQRIRLTGEGEPGARGGPKGDLYIFVSIREHDLFERDGQTLFARTPVTMATAALGGEIELPTIDGSRMKVSIPEGAQTGKRMRLKNKGMPSLRGGANGDMVVELFVETPTHLTAKQKDLLRQFQEECCPSGKCHPESQGFFKKVKKFFDQEDSRA